MLDLGPVVLARALVSLAAIIGSLLVIKFLSPIGKAVKTEELGQTKQGEEYDGD